jgi:hypothetical protein
VQATGARYEGMFNGRLYLELAEILLCSTLIEIETETEIRNETEIEIETEILIVEMTDFVKIGRFCQNWVFLSNMGVF